MKLLMLILLFISCTKQKETVGVVSTKSVVNSTAQQKKIPDAKDLKMIKELKDTEEKLKKKQDCFKKFVELYQKDKVVRSEYEKLCVKKHNNQYCHDISQEELEPLLSKYCK